MKKVIFLDAGHGGINPKGEYTTSPSKMFNHGEGVFHDDGIFYEGVKNREYCELIKKKLGAEGITVIPVYHPYFDTSLQDRVNIANFYHTNITSGIYISEHSNATRNHNAQGFQVWTSKGNTRSDSIGQKLIDIYEDNFILEEGPDLEDDLILLEDDSDGDSDYEANFYVLNKTKMPALLLENLFFDNFEDAEILMQKWYKEKYTDVIVKWVKEII